MGWCARRQASAVVNDAFKLFNTGDANYT